MKSKLIESVEQALASFCPEQEEDPTQERINQLNRKLNEAKAHFELEEIEQWINTQLCPGGPSTGRWEAITYAKVYIQRVIDISGDLADELNLPTEIAHLIAQKCLKSITTAINDTCARLLEDKTISTYLANKRATKFVPPTPHQMQAMEVELKALKAEAQFTDLLKGGSKDAPMN